MATLKKFTLNKDIGFEPKLTIGTKTNYTIDPTRSYNALADARLSNDPGCPNCKRYGHTVKIDYISYNNDEYRVVVLRCKECGIAKARAKSIANPTEVLFFTKDAF